MNFDGLSFSAKPKIKNIIAAIELRELVTLYNALRGADESLRMNMVVFLIHNPIKGWQKAIELLTQTTDAMTAVRAAAVWLMLTNLEGNSND